MNTEIEVNEMVAIINKGTGAGGANTNYYGKLFEEKTNTRERLLEMGYVEYSFTKAKTKGVGYYYLSKSGPKTNSYSRLRDGPDHNFVSTDPSTRCSFFSKILITFF